VKRFFAALLTLSLFLTACAAPRLITPPPPTALPDPFQAAWDDFSIYQNGLVTSEQSVLNKLKTASVYHLEFNIEQDIYHVTGNEKVHYTNNETVLLNEIEFRLFPNILGGEIQVSNIEVNDQSVTPKYGLENSLMIVPLSQALGPGQSIVLQMDFAVTVTQDVNQNYGVFAYYNHVLTLAHSYPMICVYDEKGWHAEIPSPNGDVTFADAAFYLVRVTAPKDLTLITTGRTIRSDNAGQTQMLIAASGPARDFFLAASPNYKEVSQTFGEVTIHSFANSESTAGAQFALNIAEKAITDYSQRYAPYPYTELDIVATPTLALGIEYPGAIAINDHIYGVNDTYLSKPAQEVLESTVAHEVGHQWFYNLVGNDQLNQPWLDESLTQFATLQYYSDTYGAEGAKGFEASLEGRWSSIDSQKIPIGLPVAAYSGGEYSGIVYGRGPLFFEALRDQIGTTAFDAFIKDYTQTLSWGIATPQILQSLAEKHCACHLDALFKEWVNP
jgi:peptidase M1-like protein